MLNETYIDSWFNKKLNESYSLAESDEDAIKTVPFPNDVIDLLITEGDYENDGSDDEVDYYFFFNSTPYAGKDEHFNDMSIDGQQFMLRVEGDLTIESGDEPVGGHGDYIKWATYSQYILDGDVDCTVGLYNPDTKEFTKTNTYKFHPIIDGEEDDSQIWQYINIALTPQDTKLINDKMDDIVSDLEIEDDYY